MANAAIVLVGVACTKGPDPIVVGAIYPISGSAGEGGIEEFHRVQVAVDLVNRAGGIDGRPIELRPLDVATPDAAGAAIAQLGSEDVRFVLGSYSSTISRPAADAAARHGMLFWETGAVGDMTGRGAGRLVFRMAPTGAVLGHSAISFIADEFAPMVGRDPTTLRFAVANVDDVYGNAVARGAVDEIGSRGLTFAGQFRYPILPKPDLSAVAEAIADVHPDVLFVSAYLDDGVDLWRQIVRRHVPLVASIGTSSSFCMEDFGERLGGEAVGLFASDKPDADTLDPGGLAPGAAALLRRANAAYRGRFDDEMTAPALSGFTAAWALFHDVMPRAPALTPDGVSAAARVARIPAGGLPNGSGLEFGAPGTADAGTNMRAASVIWEWVGVEQRAVVWPPRFATTVIRPLPLAA